MVGSDLRSGGKGVGVLPQTREEDLAPLLLSNLPLGGYARHLATQTKNFWRVGRFVPPCNVSGTPERAGGLGSPLGHRNEAER